MFPIVSAEPMVTRRRSASRDSRKPATDSWIAAADSASRAPVDRPQTRSSFHEQNRHLRDLILSALSADPGGHAARRDGGIHSRDVLAQSHNRSKEGYSPPRIWLDRRGNTHDRSADGVRSRSRATMAIVLPSSSTSRTAWPRNSSSNCRRGRRRFVPGIRDIVSTFRKMSTKPDQTQIQPFFSKLRTQLLDNKAASRRDLVEELYRSFRKELINCFLAPSEL